MSYNSEIRTLEEHIRKLENDIAGYSDSDTASIKRALDKKSEYLTQLRQLRRLQWELDHETVNFDDDR